MAPPKISGATKTLQLVDQPEAQELEVERAAALDEHASDAQLARASPCAVDKIDAPVANRVKLARPPPLTRDVLGDRRAARTG